MTSSTNGEFNERFFVNIGKELATNILSKSSSQPLNIYRVTPIQSEIQLSKELLTKYFKSAIPIGKSCGHVTSHQMIHEEYSINFNQSIEDAILHMTGDKMERSTGFMESNCCAVY